MYYTGDEGKSLEEHGIPLRNKRGLYRSGGRIPGGTAPPDMRKGERLPAAAIPGDRRLWPLGKWGGLGIKIKNNNKSSRTAVSASAKRTFLRRRAATKDPDACCKLIFTHKCIFLYKGCCMSRITGAARN